jgi:hypothetical protein
VGGIGTSIIDSGFLSTLEINALKGCSLRLIKVEIIKKIFIVFRNDFLAQVFVY